jgi:acyl-CoA reductase-like NAD-dependent aldehyde dehydrogenase
VYDTFVPKYVELVKQYKLGDPTLPETNLGPVVSVASAEKIRRQVKDAIKAGATAHIDESAFTAARE